MDTDYLTQFDELTLEPGKGETYRHCEPTLYGHSTYGRSSVLAGLPRRVFVDCWPDIETARAVLGAAGIRYTDLFDQGTSTHIPVDIITAGLPGDDDY